VPLVFLNTGGTGKIIKVPEKSGAKIHNAPNPQCLERANQLLSLLVPVSDINRMAAGTVRRQICQLHAHGEFYIPFSIKTQHARDEVYSK
jgi:hypothetical protein